MSELSIGLSWQCNEANLNTVKYNNKHTVHFNGGGRIAALCVLLN